MQDALPPLDEAAERTVLTTWISQDKFRKAWKVDPELFFFPKHQEIAKVLVELRGADEVSEGTVALMLKQRNKLQFVGGMDAVSDIVVYTPSAGDPWKHVDRLVELRGLRTLRTNLLRVLAGIDSDTEFAEAHAETASVVNDALGRVSRRVLSRKDLFQDVVRRALSDEGDDEFIANTGIKPLDDATGGHRRGHVWVLGADTNWGKSSFLVANLEEIFDQNKRALIVTGEDSPRVYANRMMARRANVSATRLRDGTLTDTERDKIIGCANQPDIPTLLDARGATAESVAADIRSICVSEGIDVVFIDYIHAFSPKKNFENRAREVAYTARIFTDAIKTSNAAGVLFSQLTLDANTKRPTRRNIRDCRDIAHGAEGVFLGYTHDDGQRVLFVDKVKDGPGGFEIALRWDAKTASFQPVPHAPTSRGESRGAFESDEFGDAVVGQW